MEPRKWLLRDCGLSKRVFDVGHMFRKRMSSHAVQVVRSIPSSRIHDNANSTISLCRLLSHLGPSSGKHLLTRLVDISCIA